MSFYNLLDIREWRYERKFFISSYSKQEVEVIVKLNPAMFRSIFFERKVNNLYFDTPDMDYYQDNVLGTKERLKIRIRWYGETFGAIEKPVLEIKSKNGQLGGKKKFALKSFTLDQSFNSSDIVQLFREVGAVNKSIMKCLLGLKCSLLNCYNRNYYLSSNGIFRSTIDTNMAFFRFFDKGNCFKSKYFDLFNVVLELKYNEKDDDYADMVTNHFPFLMTKSSKYATGLEYLF